MPYLGLRPVFHLLDTRIEAHIFINSSWINRALNFRPNPRLRSRPQPLW